MAEKASIVKQSSRIRELLTERVKVLGLSHTQIAEEAQKFGMKNINHSSLSRYFNNIPVNALSEESIIFLCWRYGIQVMLMVGKPVLKGNKLGFEVPPYDEKACLANTKKLFGNGTKK